MPLQRPDQLDTMTTTRIDSCHSSCSEKGEGPERKTPGSEGQDIVPRLSEEYARNPAQPFLNKPADNRTLKWLILKGFIKGHNLCIWPKFFSLCFMCCLNDFCYCWMFLCLAKISVVPRHAMSLKMFNWSTQTYLSCKVRIKWIQMNSVTHIWMWTCRQTCILTIRYVRVTKFPFKFKMIE